MAAVAAGLRIDNKEGWLDGALRGIISYITEQDGRDMEIAIAYPGDVSADKSAVSDHKEIIPGKGVCIRLYGYSDDRKDPHIYRDGLEKEFEDIIRDLDPDIVHLFGTEYGHNLAVGRVIGRLRRNGSSIKLLIGLQGIISECARVYSDGVPYNVQRNKTFRDRLRDDNILRQQQKFMQRGEFELEAITYATDITGRTEFDREWSRTHNPAAVYHHLNETLREEFYEGTWDLTECGRHVIFMSQGDYPLKGLHKILKVMPDILADYPDARLVVAGMNITKRDTLKDRIKMGNYGKYLTELIASGRLQDKVTFTGPLDASQMKKMYLGSHVYLCASSVENSPNSMGEAMLLGLPVIAARVGGIPSMIEDGSEGLLYDSENEIKDILHKIWDDDAFATELGAEAMNRAYKTHDPATNMNRLLEIYNEIG